MIFYALISVNHFKFEYVDLLSLPTLTQHCQIAAIAHEETFRTDSAPELNETPHKLTTDLS